jgi:hypothetical protein
MSYLTRRSQDIGPVSAPKRQKSLLFGQPKEAIDHSIVAFVGLDRNLSGLELKNED